MFPDKIAKNTIAYLADIIEQAHPYTDGTYEGLKRVTEESGVDLSIVLPIVTNPKQFETINRFAAITYNVTTCDDTDKMSFIIDNRNIILFHGTFN